MRDDNGVSAETWPLWRVLTETRPGSQGDDWTWGMEYAALWHGTHLDRTAELADSMHIEGQREPIIVGTDGRLWDGHHRVVVAMRLDLPTLLVDDLRPAPPSQVEPESRA